MTATPTRIVSPELCREITVVADQIADLVRGLTATDPKTHNTTWSIRETAAHLAEANGHFAQIAAGAQPPRHGDGTRAGLAMANAELLARFTVRDPARLAAQISGCAADFVRHVQARPATDVVDTPLGEMNVDVFCGYLLAHMLGHGCAMAVTLGQPALVTARQVTLMVPFLVLAMPRMADAGLIRDLDARYELRLRGITRLSVRFDRGTVTVGEGRQSPVDCVISLEPRSFFLICTGIRTLWPLVLLGRVTTWGRRPWIGPRFPRYFTFP